MVKHTKSRNSKSPGQNVLGKRTQKEVRKIKNLIDEVTGHKYKELEEGTPCNHQQLNKDMRCKDCGLLLTDCKHENLTSDGRRCLRCHKFVPKTSKKSIHSRIKTFRCLGRDTEHTVYWRVALLEAPYLETFKTTNTNHEEAMSWVVPLIEKKPTPVFWVKLCCTEYESHACFEWKQ